MKREAKCVGNSALLKLTKCAQEKRRENCRKRTSKLAKVFSKICGVKVTLVRTAEVVSKECEVCNNGGKLLEKQEKDCAGDWSTSTQPLCQWYQKRGACRKTTDASLQKLTKSCGYPIRVSRTKDAAPVECDLCSTKISKFLQDILNSKAPAVCTSSCDKWRHKNNQRIRAQEEVKRFKGICGDIDKFVKAGILVVEKSPAKCETEKPEECTKRAIRTIETQIKECLKKTETVSDECRRFEASMTCYGTARNLVSEWRQFCGTKVKVELPSTKPPTICTEGNQGNGPSGPVSLPGVITRPEPGVSTTNQVPPATNTGS